MNDTKWADRINFNDLPESTHVGTDINLLANAKVGDLVVSMKSGRVAPIKGVTKTHVQAFGIWFRRDNGEEKGRRNGNTFAKRIVGLTTRSRDDVVFRHWPELKPAATETENGWIPAPTTTSILESALRDHNTPEDKLAFILRSCAEQGKEFTLSIRIMFTDGTQRMYFAGYHIHGQNWVKLQAQKSQFEFAERDFSNACNRTGCEMTKRPVKQVGFTFNWFIAQVYASREVPQYTPHSKDAEQMDKVDCEAFVQHPLFNQVERKLHNGY